MKKRIFAVVLALVFVLSLMTGCGGNEEVTADCRNGNFVGQVEDSGVMSFKGIPYAKAPVGDLRWKAPEAPEDSDETFEAKEFGKTSVQYSWHSEPAGENPAGVGEDCLTLNVWTADMETAGKPVMVWIHGGGFGWGGTADPLYNGETIVQEHDDVVVVSMNYRLGMYGQMDFSRVEGGENFPDSKNLAMLDLIQGLTWVQENIEAFGGDPENVTIFGNSAGSGYAALLTSSEKAQGLFNRAICESGSLNLTVTDEDLAEQDAAGILLEATGAKNMDDLMAISEEDLIKVYTEYDIDGEGTVMNDLNYMPYRGDDVIAADPYAALESGVGSDIDLIMGSNADEWRYWVNEVGMESMLDMDEEGVAENLDIFENGLIKGKEAQVYEVATDAEKANVEAFYNLPQIAELDKVWQDTELTNDTTFRLPAVATAVAHANGGGNTYMYYFDIPSDNFDFMGACHASEVAYAFHNEDETIFSGTVDVEMADKICQAWVNFAKTGDPSIEGSEWTNYDGTDRNTMMITKDGMTMESDPLGDQRELLECFVKYYLK